MFQKVVCDVTNAVSAIAVHNGAVAVIQRRSNEVHINGKRMFMCLYQPKSVCSVPSQNTWLVCGDGLCELGNGASRSIRVDASLILDRVSSNGRAIVLTSLSLTNSRVCVMDYVSHEMYDTYSIPYSPCGAKLCVDGESFMIASYWFGAISVFYLLNGLHVRDAVYCSYPIDVVQLSTGAFVVAHGYLCNHISVFSSSGVLLERLTLSDVEDRARSLAVDTDDTVFVQCDSGVYTFRSWAVSVRCAFLKACVVV